MFGRIFLADMWGHKNDRFNYKVGLTYAHTGLAALISQANVLVFHYLNQINPCGNQTVNPYVLSRQHRV